MWDPSSLAGDQTYTPCIGYMVFQPLGLQVSSLDDVSLLREAGQGPRATKFVSPLWPPALPVSNPCSCSIIPGIEPLVVPGPELLTD